MQFACSSSAIGDAHANDDVVGSGFGVFDFDIEVRVVVKDTGIEELIFRLFARAPTVGLD